MLRFWMNYYDILVRHAFGNYFELLREVTLNPLMGVSAALPSLLWPAMDPGTDTS